MRTQGVLVVVLALGVAFAMANGAGLSAAWGIGGSVEDGDSVRKALNESEDSSAVNEDEPVTGDPATDEGDGNIVSLVLSGAQMIAGAVGRIVLLPTTLVGLGAPTWFAGAIGSLAIFVGGVGIIQFVTGRVFR